MVNWSVSAAVEHALGKKRAEYIGPVGEASAEARARSTREAVELAAALVKEARTLVESLEKGGYARGAEVIRGIAHIAA